MKNHTELRFSGSGGQGLMLMGDVFAQAAGCILGKEILMTKSYGPESRGGACRSEIIVDDDPINYPAVVSPDFMLAMTQLACDSYHADLKAEGSLLVDSDLVKNPPCGNFRVYGIPLTRIAGEETGKEIAANVVALGAAAVLCDCVTADALQAAIQERFGPIFKESNDKAFFAGQKAAKRLLWESGTEATD